tara:strand:- start:3227 stop:4018 length:792 start_codon:yes stop_codon:yes gene_type:complete
MTRKKVCKTVKGKRICNKKPQMSASDIISLQMNALQRNNKYDSGIKIAFEYASQDNQLATGPYPRFLRMVKNDIYKHLLKCKKWSFVKNTIQKIKDEKYSRMVKLQSSHDNKEYIYRFSLSRQIPSLFWRTDSVELIEGIDQEDTSFQQKNIYDEPLQVCSTDPMTGYHRSGYCFTDDMDQGTHTVCARVNDEFLEYTKNMGNDLSTPNEYFPGLKDGDNWCLCALRWKQALDAGVAPPLNLESTNKKTLEYIDKDTLKKYKL